MSKATKSGLLGISMATMTVIGSLTAYAQSNNYSVTGYNENTGSYVEGSVDTYGRDVSGYIINERNEEKYFEGEFVSRGVIEGYDEDGNHISLETE